MEFKKNVQDTKSKALDLNTETIDLLQKLQTTLDLEKLIHIFIDKLENLLKLDGAAYTNNVTDLKINRGKRAVHSANYTLTYEKQHFGNLTLYRDILFSEEDLILAENLLTTLILPLKNSFSYWLAMQSALRDSLTTIGNRRAMFSALKHKIDIVSRHSNNTSVLFVDLDNFKQINDSLGHTYGDKILRITAQKLSKMIRECDMCFRYGGDEFVIILVNTEFIGAEQLANRLKEDFIELFAQFNNKLPANAEPLSISIGFTNILPNDSVNSIIHRADKALYNAKQSGKNKIAKR